MGSSRNSEIRWAILRPLLIWSERCKPVWPRAATEADEICMGNFVCAFDRSVTKQDWIIILQRAPIRQQRNWVQMPKWNLEYPKMMWQLIHGGQKCALRGFGRMLLHSIRSEGWLGCARAEMPPSSHPFESHCQIVIKQTRDKAWPQVATRTETLANTLGLRLSPVGHYCS